MILSHFKAVTRSIPFQRAFTKRLTPATIAYKIIFIYTIRRVTYIVYIVFIVFHSCDFSNAFESFYSYTEVNEESLTILQRLSVRGKCNIFYHTNKVNDKEKTHAPKEPATSNKTKKHLKNFVWIVHNKIYF